MVAHGLLATDVAAGHIVLLDVDAPVLRTTYGVMYLRGIVFEPGRRVVMAQRCSSVLLLVATFALLAGPAVSSLASTPQAWAEMNVRSSAACAHASGLNEPKVGAPIRFSDAIGLEVRVVTGIAPQPHMKDATLTMVCAFDRRSGKAEAVEAPAAAVLTALPSAPSIEGIVWRAEDIGGGGIIDRSRATLTFGADGWVSGSASCNTYSGGFALDRGALSFTAVLVATQRACVPSLMDQERRFLAILGAARQIELLPTGALLVSTPDGKSLRFFPDQPVIPAGR